MNASRSLRRELELADQGYEAIAQLVRMLLPSSGAVFIYTANRDLAWCPDGVERPECRALMDSLIHDGAELPPNQGTVRTIAPGASALVAALVDDDGAILGYLLIELGGVESPAARAMAVSLTRPVLLCLRTQLALHKPRVVASAPPSLLPEARLNLLLAVGADGARGRLGLTTVSQLLKACIQHLECLSAVLWIPQRGLLEVAEQQSRIDEPTRARLKGTRNHLLAWARHNRRPMVVNRIDSASEQYKILSCPIALGGEESLGLFAVFRTADGLNFELNDVRVIEFLAQRIQMVLASPTADRLSPGGFDDAEA